MNDDKDPTFHLDFEDEDTQLTKPQESLEASLYRDLIEVEQRIEKLAKVRLGVLVVGFMGMFALLAAAVRAAGLCQ